MPSSTYDNLTPIVKTILEKQPKTILDIGIGFGKWGMLCREYLETWKGRVFPEQWQIKIDGIEIFEPYIEKFLWLKIFYNNLYLGNALEVIDKLKNYDLIIAGDVIEHLSKEEGIELVKKCIKKSKCFIMSVPLGKVWLNNKIVANNPYGKHQAFWLIEDINKISQEFNNYKFTIQEWKGVRGKGVIVTWSLL